MFSAYLCIETFRHFKMNFKNQCIKDVTQKTQFILYSILLMRLNLSFSKSLRSISCGGSFFNDEFVQFYTLKLIPVKIDNNGPQDDLENLLLYSLLTYLLKIRDQILNKRLISFYTPKALLIRFKTR